MSATPLMLKPWYSLNTQLKAEPQAPVSVTEALRIAERYLARAGERFVDGEAALAATLFGFGSETEFIEPCVHDLNDVHYKFEAPRIVAPWLFGGWKGIYQFEKTLRNHDAVRQCIEDFFRLSSAELLRLHETKR